jgi:hypothetical protein
MKKITFIIVLSFITLISAAQGEAPLAKGGRQLNFGVGFNTGGFPAYIGMDFAVHNDITVGGVIGLDLNSFSSLDISARGDYHFNRLLGITPNWDFYAGLNLGFRLGFNGNSGGLSLGGQVGGRYFWNEKWGVNLEFGGGLFGAGGKIGMTMKM